MKRAFYDGDKFSPVRTIVTAGITVLVGSIITWGIWVTQCSFCASAAKAKIDLQTTVLHNRITSVQQDQNTQYRKIMDHLIEIQRDINNR